MFLSFVAGIVSFVLTILAMPSFIRFYQLKKLVVSKCTKMLSNIWQKLVPQLWEELSF